MRHVDADLSLGPAGPVGPTGAAGPAGSSGPAGPAGPAGRLANRTLLAVALAEDRVGSRRSQRLRLRYAATATARVELRPINGRRIVSRARATARRGSNTLVFRAPVDLGRYRVTLNTTTRDRQRASDVAQLTVSPHGNAGRPPCRPASPWAADTPEHSPPLTAKMTP